MLLKHRKFPWKISHRFSRLIAHYSWPERRVRSKRREIKLLSRQLGPRPILTGRTTRLVGFSENRAGSFELGYCGTCKRGTEVSGQRRCTREQKELPVSRQPSSLRPWEDPQASADTRLHSLLPYPQKQILPPENFAGSVLGSSGGKEWKHLLSKKGEQPLNKHGFPAMGTCQPSPRSSWEPGRALAPLLRQQEAVPGAEEPRHLNCLKRPQVEAGWERISGQVMPMSWGEQASILPLLSLGRLFPSFQRERRSPASLPRKGPAKRCRRAWELRLQPRSPWAWARPPAERKAPEQKTILTYHLPVWSVL